VVAPSTSTVTLPTVSQQQLKNPGDTAGVQPFSITLTGCSALATGAYLAKATWSFTQGAIATTMANTAASPAANVEIQIRDASNNPIANNAVTTIASGITGGTYSAQYSARYYATGQATAGNVRGVATFNLSYQ
jgi:major type 1 subunit fimbrin (pilin)